MLAGSNPAPAAAHLQQPHQSPTQQTTTTTTTTTSGTPTQYPVSLTSQAQPTRPLRASKVDSSSHLNSHPHSSHHPAAQASHLHLHQQQQQQLNSPGMFCREDDYRKKKRVKIGNPAAGKTSGSGSSGPNHQVALQSWSFNSTLTHIYIHTYTTLLTYTLNIIVIIIITFLSSCWLRLYCPFLFHTFLYIYTTKKNYNY
jgi:hypothetical protein